MEKLDKNRDVMKFEDISSSEIGQKGVQALSDRPNMTQRYGIGGLSADQLKRRFDNLPDLLSKRINTIHEKLSSKYAAEYIRVALDEYGIKCLGEFIEMFSDGTFATEFPLICLSEGEERKSLEYVFEKIVNDFSKPYDEFNQRLNDLGFGYKEATADIVDDGGAFGVELQIINLEEGKKLHFCFKNLVQEVLNQLPTYGGETV